MRVLADTVNLSLCKSADSRSCLQYVIIAGISTLYSYVFSLSCSSEYLAFSCATRVPVKRPSLNSCNRQPASSVQ